MVLKEALLFLVKLSVWFKKKGARGVQTLVFGLRRSITFPLRYTLFVVHGKMLCFLYKVSHVLIRTKKEAQLKIRTGVTKTRANRLTSAPNLGLWRPWEINIFIYCCSWARCLLIFWITIRYYGEYIIWYFGKTILNCP